MRGAAFMVSRGGESEAYEAVHSPALPILRNFNARFFVGGTPAEVTRGVGTASTRWQGGPD